MIQNHIHLSDTLQTSGEFAPDVKWTASTREQVPEIIAAFKRTLTGKLQRHVLSDGSGPVQFLNYIYTLKLEDDGIQTAQEKLELLLSWQGKRVYLVDHFHVSDGANHSGDVKTVVLEITEHIQSETPRQSLYYVPVVLTDDYTV
jgi:hypothetical protein